MKYKCEEARAKKYAEDLRAIKKKHGGSYFPAAVGCIQNVIESNFYSNDQDRIADISAILRALDMVVQEEMTKRR